MELTGQYSNFYGMFAKIYGLYDEFDSIFYIGCTTQSPFNRLMGHLSEARTSNRESARLQKIRSLNGKVSIRQLDIIWITSSIGNKLTQEALELENFWIRKYFDAGVELTNNKPDPGIPVQEFQANYAMWENKNKTEKHLKQLKISQLLNESVEKPKQLTLI